jgi:hypothetical protein
MVSIITMTPISVSTEVSSCVRFCWSVPLMLSRSLTARAHHFAARARIEELERQPIELRFDFAPHRIDGFLRDVRHQVLHQVLKGVGDEVETDQPDENAGDGVEVDGGAGDAHRLGDEPFEDLRGRQAENLRTEHLEDRADGAGQNHDGETGAMRLQVREQAPQRAFEVLGLLRGHAEAADRAGGRRTCRAAARRAAAVHLEAACLAPAGVGPEVGRVGVLMPPPRAKPATRQSRDKSRCAPAVPGACRCRRPARYRARQCDPR